MIPVDAASKTPIVVTDIASPPGTRSSSVAKFSSSLPARPDFSSMIPIKMNIGSATSTQLFMTSHIRSTTKALYSQLMVTGHPKSISAMIPIAVKTTASPPKTHATGNPVKISTIKLINIATLSQSPALTMTPRFDLARVFRLCCEHQTTVVLLSPGGQPLLTRAKGSLTAKRS